jgi:uncharacterized membrane protein AbrB (regulator of aidB expression)
VETVGIDPLTAYLATSPGGMDSAAIIGASTKVDLSFVMALQTVRFMVVLLVGPPISRFVATRLSKPTGDVPPLGEPESQILAQLKENEDELD